MSDLGPAIVTGSVAVLVAAAGFISTGTQAASGRRAQTRATLRDEKRQAYANCLGAMHTASDAADFHRGAIEGGQHPRLRYEGARGVMKAGTDLTIAVTTVTLVAPSRVTSLAWKAARAIRASEEPGGDPEAGAEALVDLLEAMRADLGVPD